MVKNSNCKVSGFQINMDSQEGRFMLIYGQPNAQKEAVYWKHFDGARAVNRSTLF